MSRIDTGRPIYQKGAKPVKSPILRNSARDESCTLRLPGCDGSNATTVLAHIRRFGWGGMSGKPADYKACYACGPCHDKLDSRDPSMPVGDDDILRAMGETLDRQFASGNLILKGTAK